MGLLARVLQALRSTETPAPVEETSFTDDFGEKYDYVKAPEVSPEEIAAAQELTRGGMDAEFIEHIPLPASVHTRTVNLGGGLIVSMSAGRSGSLTAAARLLPIEDQETSAKVEDVMQNSIERLPEGWEQVAHNFGEVVTDRKANFQEVQTEARERATERNEICKQEQAETFENFSEKPITEAEGGRQQSDDSRGDVGGQGSAGEVVQRDDVTADREGIPIHLEEKPELGTPPADDRTV